MRREGEKNIIPILAMQDELSHFTVPKSNRMGCLRISNEFVAIPYLLSA